MNHQIIRPQPVTPPVEKIVLDLTPQEFLGVLRAVAGSSPCITARPTMAEISHGIAAVTGTTLFNSLTNVAREAGITR